VSFWSLRPTNYEYVADELAALDGSLSLSLSLCRRTKQARTEEKTPQGKKKAPFDAGKCQEKCVVL
jgi:hypothetical protein